ncbi:hypothetical protein [Streptomyces sp. NPDC002159]
MEEAAESVTSMDVEAVESLRVADRFGERPQGCSAVQGAVSPMLVIEGLELAERVKQVGLASIRQLGLVVFCLGGSPVMSSAVRGRAVA